MPRRRMGFWYTVAVLLLRPPWRVMTRHDWRGASHLPRAGGVVVCTNHISHADPLAFAHFLFDNGRLPRFLVKSGMFSLFFIGTVLRGARQIPVYRESADAGKAFAAAVAAVRRGECVAIYPEATLTRDPGLWPMVGKTGAARVALTTGAPVIPVAQWGAQDVLAPYGRRLHLVPRRTVHVLAGPPVDLSEFEGHDLNAVVLREATEKIMSAITRLLEDLRGETAPSVRLDPRTSDLPVIGNPHRSERRRTA